MVLHHVVSGSGPTCLVLHGGPGLDHQYMRSLERLGLPLRFVFVDLPGHGRSDPIPVDAFTPATWARELDALLDHLGEARALILAHSFGPTVAMEYALASPERVAGLVIVASGFEIDPDARARGARTCPALAEAWFSPFESTDEGYKAFLDRVMPLYFHGKPPEGYARLPEGTLYRVKYLRGLGGRELERRASGIRCPALVLQGAEDFILPARQGERIRRAIPGAQMVVFEACGHFPWLERPAAFKAAIEGWLASVGTPRAPSPADGIVDRATLASSPASLP